MALLLAAVLFPVYATNGHHSMSSCLSNVKRLSLGFAMYANDYDDRLPPSKAWMDSIHPYATADAVYHCPWIKPARPDAYGYAMRGRLSGIDTSKIRDPEKEPLDFDSNLLGRNAVTDLVILPDFTRHRGQNVGFVDGHVHLFVQETSWK